MCALCSKGATKHNKKINKDRLRTKFSAFNVDFDGLSLNFLGSRKPAPDGIKEQYPRKSYFTVVG